MLEQQLRICILEEEIERAKWEWHGLLKLMESMAYGPQGTQQLGCPIKFIFQIWFV